MITAENITSHELIGLDTKITQSTNPQVIGLNGRIVDETKSMFTINTKNGQKLIAKSTSSWLFSINYQKITIKGSQIAKRSFERFGGKK